MNELIKEHLVGKKILGVKIGYDNITIEVEDEGKDTIELSIDLHVDWREEELSTSSQMHRMKYVIESLGAEF